MHKRILSLFVLITAACSIEQEHTPVTYPDHPSIIGLATAIQLSEDGTAQFYYSDYFDTTVDSVKWPDGILESPINSNVSQLMMSNESLPMQSVARFFSQGQVYDLILQRSRKIPVEFAIPAADFQGQIVTIFGSFNAWNRTSDTLKLEGDQMVHTAYLQPGVHEYKFYMDGVEFNDPTHERTVSNGMGGFNSTVEITSRGLPPQPIRTINSEEGIVYLKSLPANQNLMVLWENVQLPPEYIQVLNDTISVSIPKSAVAKKRSTLRFFSSNSSGWSKEVRIPLHNGMAIREPSLMDRSDWNTARMYFMMVDRFANGDSTNDQPLDQPDVLPQCDYQGGDVAGILQKLRDGYFDELGVNTLWLSPITKNPTDAWGLWDEGGVYTKFSAYHGYWPISNVIPDSRFTTKDQLTTLLNEAHAKGYNVVLDYVANHVHQSHPIYRENQDWATDLYLPDGTMNTEKWDEHRLTTWFDTFLPTLDLRRPEVVDPLTDSALTWVTEYDFDGFRHDATKHIDLLFWRTLTSKVKERVTQPTGKRIYQIGETYGSAELISSYLSTGMLDAQFDFNAYDAILNVLADSTVPMQRIVDVMNSSWDWYGQHNTMGYISGNQDRSRFISLASEDVSQDEDQKLAGYIRNIGKPGEDAYKKLALLHAFNHSIPGIPVIYYGDEYGSPGANDPDNRRMMKFDELDEDEQWLKEQVVAFENLRSSEMALLYGAVSIEPVSEEILHIQRQYLNETIDVYINRGQTAQNLVLKESDTLLYGRDTEGQIPALSAIITKTLNP